MAIVNVSGLTKSFGINKILEDVNFLIEEKDKIGLVGLNGAGKSTLLKILSGKLTYDSGQIFISKGISIGFLSQEWNLESSKTIGEALAAIFKNQYEQEKELRKLEMLMSSAQVYENKKKFEDVMHRYSVLFEEFKNSGGFEIQSRIRGVIKGLGFDDENTPISNLSGGQKTRLALGRILLKSPDLLLLDEPTNYLDLQSVQWLEGFLKDFPKAVLVVSHDRFFLDNIANKIFELENNRIAVYRGNYSDYVKKKKSLVRISQKHEEIRQSEIERLQKSIQTFISHRKFSQAQSRKKILKELLSETNSKKSIRGNTQIKLKFESNQVSGKEVVQIENLTFAYKSHCILKNVNAKIFRGQRIGIIGPNGIGKSTFLKILAGKLKPQEGIVNFGHNVKIVYFDQEQQSLSKDSTVLDEVWKAAPKLGLTEIRSFLAGFLFFEEDIDKKIGTLSGGEKSRVALAKIILKGANLLLLDEPTNHLDMLSKEKLEDALKNFSGTIIAVSHDRYFLSKIANQIWEFHDNNIKVFDGGYSYYLEKSRQSKEDNPIRPVENKTLHKKIKQQERMEREKKRRHQKKLKELEECILQKEKELEELEQLMCKAEVYRNPQKAKEVNIAYNKLLSDLENLYEQLDAES